MGLYLIRDGSKSQEELFIDKNYDFKYQTNINIPATKIHKVTKAYNKYNF